MKFKYGALTNMDGATKPIIVNSAILKPKELIIGSSLVIAGIAYIMSKAYRNGVKGYVCAEYHTMVELGIIHE